MIRVRGRRLLLYALLALAVPLPAFALSGGEGSSQALSVSASLGGCGLAQTTIMCEIDASWNTIDQADYYTASVSAPDGSVTDFGDVSSGSASVYVPYVGDGSYSVQVTAWGEPDKPDQKPRVIARENSSSAPEPSQTATQNDPSENDPGRDSSAPEDGSSSPAASVGDQPGAGATAPAGPTGATGATGPAEPPVTTTPVDPAPPPTDCSTPDPTTPDPDASATSAADSADGSSDGGADADADPSTPPDPAPPADPACR